MITIRVGPENDFKDFVAHESFLKARSEFFRRALSGAWEESRSRIVKLPEDEPDIVALYLNLVYTKKLTIIRGSEEDTGELELDEFKSEFASKVHAEFYYMFAVYVLAEKLQDGTAKNEVMTAAFERLERKKLRNGTLVQALPSRSTVEMVYAGTPENSPARRLMVALWGNVDMTTLAQAFNSTMADWVSDLAKEVAALRPLRSGEAGHRVLRQGLAAYLEVERH